MEEMLQEIMTHSETLELSVDTCLLHKYTKLLTGVIVKKIRWNILRQLYILGSDKYIWAKGKYEGNFLQPGSYTDSSGEWVLIVGAETPKIQEYLSRCTSNLEVLEVRFTSILELDVEHLTGLKELTLDNNHALVEVSGLERLRKLVKLDISNTSVGPVLILNGLPMLKELLLDRTYISSIQFLSKPLRLRSFHARYSNLEDVEFLSSFQEINTVDLTNTNISELPPLDNLIELEQLYVSGTRLNYLPELKQLKHLKLLNLSASSVSSLEGITFPEHLTYMDLSKTPIQYLPNSIGLLRNLQTLDLSDMRLEQLPDWLPDLGLEFSLEWGTGIRLRNTSIVGVDMSIFSQPREMIVQWFKRREKNLRFKNEVFSDHSFPVFLGETNQGLWSERWNIADVQSPGIPANYVDYRFSEPHSMKTEQLTSLRNLPEVWVGDKSRPKGSIFNGEWDPRGNKKAYASFWKTLDSGHIITGFSKETCIRERTKSGVAKETPAPLNEVKIVFLGDGEAGKSHIIARLLKDGQQANDFPYVSTPGIVIQNKIYDIGSRCVQVHFWDFGGQEILHSMHRMFLTIQTLYVVVLNVREGNQDERARYWLHNICCFANGSPVLLVLNKMDMNRNASINERDLRNMYPHLSEIVRMSALSDSIESFESNLIAALKRQIDSFDIVESPFLPAWSRLKERLQNMDEPYIRGKQYIALSAECGVEKSDKIQKALLQWFSNLGVSFHYGDSAKLDDYVVLRPDWITNAVYIIIFNKMDEVKNGLVSHEAIYHLLNPSPGDADTVKRSVQGVAYEVGEVEYVLNVIRKFRLSFQIDDKMEFIPMLCDRNSAPVADEYASDPLVLELRMEYDYLPNNVLHRIMVDQHRDLDRDNVWLTGARFVYGNTGLSAVVKSEGNLLRIMVRSEKSRYTADIYLDLLKDDLEQINADMGLRVINMKVAYKADGIVEYFDYKMLLAFLAIGTTVVPSQTTMKPIPIRDILMQTDHRVDENKKKLILDL